MNQKMTFEEALSRLQEITDWFARYAGEPQKS